MIIIEMKKKKIYIYIYIRGTTVKTPPDIVYFNSVRFLI